MEEKNTESKTENQIENLMQNNGEKKTDKKRNHWTAENINAATVKINRDVYGKNRQAPIQIKLDDLAILINDRITRRGIAKGLVSIQEKLNNSILEAEKKTMEALLTRR